MRFSYRGAVAMMKVLMVPYPCAKGAAKKWVTGVEKHAKSGMVTPRQAAHLRALVREVRRRWRFPKNTKLYSTGMLTSKYTPARKGKSISVPFGTWYIKPKN